MKVDSIKIKELFTSIMYLTDVISETVAIGDDGFELSVKNTVDDIKKALVDFELSHMLELNKIDENKKLDYLNHYEKYAYDIENSDEKKMYKAKLYLHIKKEIKENIDAEVLSSIPNEELMTFLEVNTVHNSHFSKAFNSDKFFFSTILVLEDVTKELIQHRTKNPQLKLL